jgi:hypothetical protein
VLADFGLDTPGQFLALASKLKEAYDKRLGEMPSR